jgi:signal transduction histidine kinase
MAPGPGTQPQLVRRTVIDALADVALDPLWIVDAGGFLLTGNAAFQRWWHELTGTRPERGQLLDGRPPRLAELERRALDGRSVMSDIRLVAGGVERTYAIHARPAGPEGAAFTAREERSDAAAGIEGSVELALLHLFASDDALPELLAKALEFLCATDGWDAAILWDAGADALSVNATWFASDEAREKLESRVRSLHFTRGHGVPGRAWALREVVWIADILEESTIDRSELAAAAGLHSVVAAPLVDAERVTGVVEFFTRAVRPMNERSKRALARTGNALGRLIERRRLVEMIERKGAEWMMTFDSIELPIILVHSDCRLVRLNLAARGLMHLEFEQIVGHSLTTLGEGEPWKTLCDTVTAVRDSGMACTAQITTDTANWDVAASPFASPDGEDDRVILAMRDTTEVVRLQDAMRRGEQLAALGELVAGVAHEVKNPLFGMGVTLDLLDDLVRDNGEARELTGALRSWIRRLQSLTENLLAFGKTWTTDMQPGSVTEVVREAIAACEHRAVDARATIEASIAADAVILMDASRLVLVFENLLVNALQHSPAGGTVHVESSVDDEAIEIRVRDEGPGFRPDDLPRIFQPFFTRRRGGTGLGLSIVQRITDEHGGTVNAENGANGGAAVRVRLPRYRQST